MKLTPATVGSTLENDVVSVGFTDFIEAPGRGLVLSRLLTPTDRDIEAGEDTYDLSDENGWSVYAPFTEARLLPTALIANLSEEAQRVLHLADSLTIDLALIAETDLTPLVENLVVVIPELANQT